MSKLENYGMNVNFSLAINNETEYEIGVHITDSNGIDLDSKASSDNMEDCLNAIVDEILEEYISQAMEKAFEKEPQEEPNLEQEVKSLKTDNALLEARIKDLQEKLMSQKVNQQDSNLKPPYKVTCNNTITSEDLYKDMVNRLKLFQDPHYYSSDVDYRKPTALQAYLNGDLDFSDNENKNLKEILRLFSL